MNEVTNQVNSNISLQFWGVRGEIATPGKETVLYGGNTSCLQIKIGEKCLIFDAGTGIRELGNKFLSQMPIEAYMFFTNCHWDRIQGFPFFVPAFIPGNKFHIYGSQVANGSTFEQRLSKQMLGPNFPVSIALMASQLKFNNLSVGKVETLDNITIETEFLNYEHRSIGYRVNCDDFSIVYATDIKKNSAILTKNLLNLAKNADLLIINNPHQKQFSSFNKENDFWLNYLEIINTAKVKQVILSTYHPEHNDEDLEKLEFILQKDFPCTSLAREGKIINLN